MTASAQLCDVHDESRLAADAGDDRTQVLLLSTSLLRDRMMLYTGFMDELARKASARVWAMSADDPEYQRCWEGSAAEVEPFPAVQPFKEFPYNYLRRLNEFTWYYRQNAPSQLSMMRLTRSKSEKLSVRSLRLPARALALMSVEKHLEDWLERRLLNYNRSPEALDRLRRRRPHVLVSTGPFWYEEPAIVSAAKQLGIPTIALIPSWDNLSTKNRLVFKYDGYMVWSEQAKQELHHYYPDSRHVPVFVIGAPPFDVFFQERFHVSRAEFCAAQGLDPAKPVVVHALGSPNLIGEDHAALDLARRVVAGELGDAQLVIRPHPIHDNAEIDAKLREFEPRVVVQRTGRVGRPVAQRFQDEEQIRDWVNTFRHADVVVNLASTATIDAAIFDRPVVNLDYDPEPGAPNGELVHDINHVWSHFKPVAESGGVWLTNDAEETVEAVRTYLEQPELHRQERRWMAEHVCGYLDGRCGERMAHAIHYFVRANCAAAGNGQKERTA